MMDSERFDGLVKRLATRASRRDVVKGLGGGAVAGALALVGAGRTTAANNVGVCHHTGSDSNPVVFIMVNEHAIPAHQAHGDEVGVDLQTDLNNCGACGVVCGGGDVCNAPSCDNGTCGTTPVDGASCTTDTGVGGTCSGGTCVANSCANAVLAGSADGGEPVCVDDDLNVLVNGASVFADTDKVASCFPEIALGSVTNGDSIEVIATNSPIFGAFETLSPLYLICLDTGAVQTLDATGHETTFGPGGEVFYDQTFIIAI